MGVKTKIDWCDATWNPVTGCLHGCEYCYARKIAERFEPYEIYDPEMAMQRNLIKRGQLKGTGKPYDLIYHVQQKNKKGEVSNAPYPFGFAPTFHRYKLGEPKHWKKPRNIFVCSMADLFGDWVPDEWIAEVFRACEAAPQHRYLFLTKNPKRYCDLMKRKRLPKHDNFWYGSTLDKKRAKMFYSFRYHTFASIEPITEYLNMDVGSFAGCEWVIVGAETGNRKEKITPDRVWIENVVAAAKLTRTPVFMKESLRGLMGADLRQEFPWEE